MTKLFHYTICFFLLLLAQTFSKAHAQVPDSVTLRDSIIKMTDTIVVPAIDSIALQKHIRDSIKHVHTPRKAAIRSAILPGWGQVYNKRWWKVPIVWGALGTTAYVFKFNVDYYKELKFAYAARYKAALPPFDPASPYQGPYQDSTDYFKLKSVYKNPRLAVNSIKDERDNIRRNVDYSVLVFIAFWGLNVIDASVDAHLRNFDVSPDLSLRFKAGYNEIGKNAGVALVLHFK